MILLKEVKVKYNNLGVPDTVYKGVIRQTDSYVTRLVIDLTDIPGDIINAGLNVRKEDGTTNTDGLIVTYPIPGQPKKFYVDISNWFTNIPGTLEITVQALASMNGLTQVFNCSKIEFAIEGTAIELDPTVVPEFFNVLSVNGQTGIIEITHENIGDGSSIVKDNPDNPNAFKFKSIKGSEKIIVTENENDISLDLDDINVGVLIDEHNNDAVAHPLIGEALSSLENEKVDKVAGQSLISDADKEQITTNKNAIADINSNKITKVSELENDSGFITVEDIHEPPAIPDVSIQNGNEETGKYIKEIKVDDTDKHKLVVTKDNLPSIPVISNNIITDASSTEKGISVKATKDYVDLKAMNVYRFKGSVASHENLPTENMVLGDVWNVTDTGVNYAWDGLDWDNLGMSVDLSNYVQKDGTKVLTDNNLTDALKANYNAAYTHSQTSHAPSGAQVNVIETVKVNGVALPVTSKAVDITIPDASTVGGVTNLGVQTTKEIGLGLCNTAGLFVFTVSGKPYFVETEITGTTGTGIQTWIETSSSNSIKYVRALYNGATEWYQYTPQLLSVTNILYWESTKDYNQNDVVSRSGKVYYAKQYNSGSDPSTDTTHTYWGEVDYENVQPDWNQIDNTKDDYIKNKPTVPTISTSVSTDASSDTKTASPKAVKDYVDTVVGDIETLLGGI